MTILMMHQHIALSYEGHGHVCTNVTVMYALTICTREYYNAYTYLIYFKSSK